MNQNKDFDEEIFKDFNEENLNDEYFQAQKKLIRKREILKRRAQRRNKRRQKINRIKKTIKVILKTAGSKTIKYLGRCFDPAVLMPIIGSLFIYREIAKFSTSASYTMPISEPAEIHADNSLSGQVKRVWEDHWPKIITGSGVILAGVGRHVYLNWKLESAQKQVTVTKHQLREAEAALEQSHKAFEGFKVESEKQIKWMKQEHATKLEKSEQDLADFKVESEQQRNSLIKTHETQVNKLHVTLNRFNSAALESAARETAIRKEIQRCQHKIGELVEERDLLKEQIIQIQNASDRKDEQINDLELETKVLTKKLAEAMDEQADLTVTIDKLEQERSASILTRIKLKNRLKKAKSNYQELQKKLQHTEKELDGAQQDKKRIESELKREGNRLNNAQVTIDNFKQEAQTTKRELKKANDITDRYAKKMDEAQHQMELYQKTISIVTQEKGNLELELDKKEALLQEANKENQILTETLDDLKVGLGANEVRTDEIISEMEKTQAALDTASKKEQKRLYKTIQAQEKELQTAEKKNKKLKDQIIETEYKLIDSDVHQQKLLQEMGKLEDRLDKQIVKTSELDATIQQKEEHFYNTLQKERAQQDERYSTTVRDSTQIMNEILDQQERDQAIHWWQKLPIRFRFSPQVTLKKQEKEVVKETDYRFYPSFVHEHIFPESIVEREDSSGRKEIIRPKVPIRIRK